MTKSITHVATTDISAMMSPGSERRMELPGFDPEFVDFPHFIVRITEQIWHERQVELCLKYYSDDCVIHTLAGDISGAQTVVDNTWATLEAFPDRRLDADNVIWSNDGDGMFYSSHLITSKMTNEGTSEFGPATGRHVRAQTIADCLCQNNQVIEEWLVRDNLSIVEQLGFDANTLAKKQASADKESGFDLIEFHTANRSKTARRERNSTISEEAIIASEALIAAFVKRDLSKMADLYDYRVSGHFPGGVSLYGPDQIANWILPFSSALSDISVSIDHIAEIPYLGDAKDVAIRWSLSAEHDGDGRYGDPTGAPIYILGVSQFRVMNGRVREEVCIWDDLAVRRQIETARLAK